jgi:hypothetical protein
MNLVGFEVPTAVSTKMAVFWVVEPCSLVVVYQRFRGPCCLHHQGDETLVNFYQITQRYKPEDRHLQYMNLLTFFIHKHILGTCCKAFLLCIPVCAMINISFPQNQ